jgi:glycerol-3-phosphate O-acyltransferase
MDNQFGFKTLLWVTRPLFWLIKPSIIPGNPLTVFDVKKEDNLVFFLATKSLLDRMILHKICKKYRIATPHLETKLALEPNHTGLIYLTKLGLFQPLRNKNTPFPLLDLIKKLQSDDSFNCKLVPVSIIWGRNPDRKGSTSWFKLLFQDDENAGMLQKLFIAFAQGRDLLVNFGKPINLRDQLNQNESSQQTAKKLRRVIRVHFRQQRNVALGPPVYNLSDLTSQIVHAHSIRRLLEKEKPKDSTQVLKFENKVRGYVKEIAADQKHSTIKFLSRTLGRIFNKVFDGIEAHNVDNVRRIAATHELIFTSAHRSHFDYLLLGRVLFEAGVQPPHTAAGINLNFWPVGNMLRRSGAFFLRRRFGGNKLYTAVFHEYIHALVQRGHSISFYPEGGRSRNGRLLQPKIGMISMVVESFLRSSKRPILFVPVYIGYDTVAEIKSYQKELLGSKKKPETFKQLFQARKIFKRRFGKAYVNFGAPIDLGKFIEATYPNWRNDPQQTHQKNNWVHKATDHLAQNIMIEINRSAIISPVALVSTALLATPRRALTESDLKNFLSVCSRLFADIKVTDAAGYPSQDPQELIDFAEQVSKIQRFKYPGNDILHVTEIDGGLMSYYKNNISHVFAIPALIANYFVHQNSVRRRDIVEGSQLIYQFLQKELFLPWNPEQFKIAVNNAIDSMIKIELLTENDEVLTRAPLNSGSYSSLKLVAGTLQAMIERYGITLLFLAQRTEGVKREEIETQCQLLAQRISLLGGFNDPEYQDKTLYRNCINILEKSDLLRRSEQDQSIIIPQYKIQEFANQVSLILSPDVRFSIQAEPKTKASENG